VARAPPNQPRTIWSRSTTEATSLWPDVVRSMSQTIPPSSSISAAPVCWAVQTLGTGAGIGTSLLPHGAACEMVKVNVYENQAIAGSCKIQSIRPSIVRKGQPCRWLPGADHACRNYRLWFAKSPRMGHGAARRRGGLDDAVRKPPRRCCRECCGGWQPKPSRRSWRDQPNAGALSGWGPRASGNG